MNIFQMSLTPKPPTDIPSSKKSGRKTKILSIISLSGSSKTTLEQWIQGLPLAETLTELFPKDIFDVTSLTSDQINDIITFYSSNICAPN